MYINFQTLLVTYSSHVAVESRCCRCVTLLLSRVTLLSLLQSPYFLYSSHPLKSCCCRVTLLFFTPVTLLSNPVAVLYCSHQLESRYGRFTHSCMETPLSRGHSLSSHVDVCTRVTHPSHVGFEVAVTNSSHVAVESRCCRVESRTRVTHRSHVGFESRCCRCVTLLLSRVTLLSLLQPRCCRVTLLSV